MRTHQTIPVLDRLMKHSSPAANGCLEWIGYVGQDGYAMMKVEGKMRMAHRVSYSVMRGPIPDGMTIDHLCRNRKCIAPEHLEIVTLQENIRRAHPRLTHCNRGHEYNEKNTYLYLGLQKCRKCNIIRTNIYRSKNK